MKEEFEDTVYRRRTDKHLEKCLLDHCFSFLLVCFFVPSHESEWLCICVKDINCLSTIMELFWHCAIHFITRLLSFKLLIQ